MKWLCIVFLSLCWSAALHADEIDYFCLFATQVAAEVDTNVGVFWNTGSLAWDQSVTFPGVKIVTPAALINGISPITGFWIVVSTAGGNAGLDADAACVMKLDRDLAALNGSFVLAASISGTNRTSLTFSPVPHGSKYPNPLGK